MQPDCPSCGAQFIEGANFCFKCAAPRPAEESKDPLVGTTLGQYRVLSVLGEGAMGKVYKAEQQSLGRPAAIKTLLPHLAKDPKLVKRFEREARTTSALRHPNIVGILDFGRTDEGLLYLVMEYIDGRTLRQVIKEDTPLPLQRIYSLTDQILSALEEAHGAGVLHRDLKPENVLITKLRDGSDLVKVVDFGIAKLVDAGPEPALTGTGMIVGTPGYMAPEQILGEELDARMDVYAAGVILYELITGQPPFRGGTSADLMRRHVQEVPASPSTLATFPVPPAVDVLVLTALEKKRERRFRSAIDFKNALGVLRRSGGSMGSDPVAAGTAVMPAVAAAATRAAVPCPKCGHAEASDRKFCGECGAAMSGEASASSTGVAGTKASLLGLEAASKMLPRALIEHLGDMPLGLSAEKRNATVVFADLSGFTRMSSTMDPEEVRQVMNRCFDGMVEAVHRYDGMVDKFIGDCIMVVFGAPNTHEDDPERAVRCGLDMLAYMDEVNKTLAVPLGFRVGINTGEVVAGAVGSEARMDYTVIGDVVNTAQRLESNAKIGTIMVSRAVHNFTREAIEYKALPPVLVKGKTEPIEVFEVVGLLGESKKSEGEIVGRGRELKEIQNALVEVREGRGRGRVILGEAGIGKTRVLEEVGRIAAAEGFRVAHAGSGRFGAHNGMDLMRQAVLAIADGLPGVGGDEAERIERLTSLGIDPSEVSQIQTLLGTKRVAAGVERNEQRMLDRAALVRLFKQAGGAGGLCLLLDDLHLADEESLAFLVELEQEANAVVAIIATARPGDTEMLLPKTKRLELSPLSEAETLLIARQALSGDELPHPVAVVVAERSEGNPLFATELVRSFIDNGMLELGAGTWHATGAFDAGTIPGSLARLVASRVDSVSPAARQLLRYGAVSGRMFSVDVVGAAMEPQADIGTALSECVNHGLLRPTIKPAGGYEFVQALARESILGSLIETDSKAIHKRLAETIERGIYWGSGHPARTMAKHFLAAGQSRKAIRYLTVCGDRMAARGRFATAAEVYSQGLDLALENLSKLARLAEDAAAGLLHLATKAVDAVAVASPSEAIAIADKALAFVPAVQAVQARADTVRARGAAILATGKPERALPVLEEALRLAREDPKPELVASIRAELAAAKEAKGDLAGATETLMEGFAEISSGTLDIGDLLWRYLNQLGRVHLKAQEPEKAREFFDNARTQAARVESVIGEAKAVANLAGTTAMLGDVARAMSMYTEARELSERAGDRVGVARIDYNVGRILLGMGKQQEAVQRLRGAREMAMNLGWREGIAALSQVLDSLKSMEP